MLFEERFQKERESEQKMCSSANRIFVFFLNQQSNIFLQKNQKSKLFNKEKQKIYTKLLLFNILILGFINKYYISTKKYIFMCVCM